MSGSAVVRGGKSREKGGQWSGSADWYGKKVEKKAGETYHHVMKHSLSESEEITMRRVKDLDAARVRSRARARERREKGRTYVQKSPSVLTGELAADDFGRRSVVVVIAKVRGRRILHRNIVARSQRPAHAIAMRIIVRRNKRIRESQEGRSDRGSG